jgi:KUP system potassium uptake protein
LTDDHSASEPQGRHLSLSILGALGVVFGDIGTSPLYALRECFSGPHAVEATRPNILGVLSLIFWSLVIVISVKYLAFIMRADNRGEGGILALMALGRSKPGEHRERWLLIVLGLFGAALLYGDGIITPAISVLSAVEGLHVATPLFDKYVLWFAAAILIALFLVQKWGTAGIGFVFGPVMCLWFLVLMVLGGAAIFRNPSVLEAILPGHAFGFFAENGVHAFAVLGSVFLVVTGGEALYADMGHFGRRPIRAGWFGLVLPALLLNYFGQGALLISESSRASNPFYYLAPTWSLIPLVVLATVATSIASQAVISGAFSLTRQAVLLGYSPRVEIKHTSASEIGQIYVPGVNLALMIACIWLVFEFKTSSNLAAAYGVAVTATMAITTVLFYFVARERMGMKPWAIGLLCAIFLIIDLAFFGANIIKVADGGWVPLAVGTLGLILMTTWKTGRRILGERMREAEFPIDLFLQDIAKHPPLRVKGTAVFMFRYSDGIPPALLHNLKHNQVLHERVVFLTVLTQEVPHVRPEERVKVETLGMGFYRIIIRYGFMEDPDVPQVISKLKVEGLQFTPMETTYFLGRETLIPSKKPGMALWRERLFVRMSRNERTATSFFKLPPNRVVEMGAQIEL